MGADWTWKEAPPLPEYCAERKRMSERFKDKTSKSSRTRMVPDAVGMLPTLFVQEGVAIQFDGPYVLPNPVLPAMARIEVAANRRDGEPTA